VQYVRRGEHPGVADNIGKLNEFMFAEDKASKDQELAEWFYICGTSYRMILPDEDADPKPIRTIVLSRLIYLTREIHSWCIIMDLVKSQ